MKTNLAYINDHFEEAVVREEACPSAPASYVKRAETPKMIAGFEVLDEAERDRVIEEGRNKRREALAKYRSDRDALGAQLAGVGVTAIAFLPSSAWSQVWRSAGLFLAPWDGQVGINVSRLTERWETMRSGGGFLSRPVSDSEVRTLVERHIKGRAHGEVMREFLKPGRDARITLPKPPMDVAMTLLKVADLKPKTVAVYEAVAFADGTVEAVSRALKRDLEREQREREFREWLKNDPIVYVEHGDATAIVAQFGEFPIEKEVIDRVTSVDFMPLDQVMSLADFEAGVIRGIRISQNGSVGIVGREVSEHMTIMNVPSLSASNFIEVDNVDWTRISS